MAIDPSRARIARAVRDWLATDHALGSTPGICVSPVTTLTMSPSASPT